MNVRQLRHLVDMAKSNINEGNAPLHLVDIEASMMGLQLNREVYVGGIGSQRRILGGVVIDLAWEDIEGAGKAAFEYRLRRLAEPTRDSAVDDPSYNFDYDEADRNAAESERLDNLRNEH